MDKIMYICKEYKTCPNVCKYASEHETDYCDDETLNCYVPVKVSTVCTVNY